MRKITVALAIFLYASTLVLTASAQTTDSPTPNPQTTPNLVGSAIALVALVIIIAIIVFAGYKIVRKWSSGQSD